MNERDWDKLLRIHTAGRDDSHADTFRYPYEPTPYRVLERLAGSGCIRKDSTVIDYGCGKGRVGCFLAYQTGCRVIGVDHDARLIEKALENEQNAPRGSGSWCSGRSKAGTTKYIQNDAGIVVRDRKMRKGFD